MNTFPLFPTLSPELRAYIEIKPDMPVYHYTSLASLYGILETRKLWASHVTSLNDDAEYQWALNMVRSVCKRVLRGGPMPWNTLLGYFLEHFSRLMQPELFVCSFSELPDLLSQWRAYAPGGDGVSIGVSQDSLVKLAENNSAQIVRCIYDIDRQKELIETSIGLCIEGARGDEDSPELESRFLDLSKILSFVAPALKHPSFAEEREWRIVRLADQSATIRFRTRRNAVVPFLEFVLPERNGVLTLDSVTIGPTRNKSLAIAATNSMVRIFRVSCNKIQMSSTPYRSQ